MKKGILFLVLLLVLQSSFVFADKKLDTNDESFDLKNYDRSILSNEITLIFEGVLEEEITYDMTLNQSEKFEIAIAKGSFEGADYKNNKGNYKIGDMVNYNGSIYECIQSHKTYGDPNWAPGIALDLWHVYKQDDDDNESDDDNDSRSYNNRGADYKIGDTVTYNGKTYVCIQNHKTNGDPNWAPGIANSLWKESSNDNEGKDKHYQIKVYDENGKLVKVSNIKIKGEFSEANLDFNLGDYINVAMGYDIEICNSSNGGKVVISAAPSIGYIILIFYAVVAGFILLRIRKG